MFLVGVSIGAGFVSGAELVSFFACKHILLSIALFSVVFFLMSVQLLNLGKKYGGYEGTIKAVFGRGAKVALVVLPLFSLVPCAGMLAGLDALLPEFAPLSALIGAGVVLVVLRYGMRGMSGLNTVLVPVLLLFLFVRGEGVAFSDPLLQAGWGGGVLYAGMNVFLALPSMLDLGKEVKHAVLSSLFSSLIIAAGAACVLGQIVREGANALTAELPLLYVMRGSALFSVISALAIFSSLTSSVYALFQGCNGKTGRAMIVRKAIMLLSAFALSRFGLVKIVTYVYPVFGCFGIAFSLLCVFHEYFFQKHHQKVHSRGKQTENERRRHNKIETEHLPAVHD